MSKVDGRKIPQGMFFRLRNPDGEPGLPSQSGYHKHLGELRQRERKIRLAILLTDPICSMPNKLLWLWFSTVALPVRISIKAQQSISLSDRTVRLCSQ